MGTRSTINMQLDDGVFEGVFCHWDGYLTGVGKQLKTYYNTKEKIMELISMGSISSLRDDIPNSEFYCRDRGEDIDIRKYQSLKDIPNEDYNYVFINDQWLYCIYGASRFESF